MTGRTWITKAIAFLRGHAQRMREPVEWKPAAPPPPNFRPDRNGNHTVRARQQINTLRAADDAGRECVILEIVPIEPVEGYDSLRYVHGRPRYELKDGTPVVQRGDRMFEAAGQRLWIISQSDARG